MKIVHFIGAVKPWHHTFNLNTGQVEPQPDAGQSGSRGVCRGGRGVGKGYGGWLFRGGGEGQGVGVLGVGEVGRVWGCG